MEVVSLIASVLALVVWSLILFGVGVSYGRRKANQMKDDVDFDESPSMDKLDPFA